ncbi:MAG TPA: hypothetical protein VFY39_03625 [Gammaproteobacteria bacterium]|nr:hypothetical protein [Gammaproteobacteria bacterium]
MGPITIGTDLLLDAEADSSLRDYAGLLDADGKTALDLANDGGYADAAEILRARSSGAAEER